MVPESELRAQICEIGRRIHARGWVAGSDGNISARLADGTFLCTPSGKSKGYLDPDDLIVADGDGVKVSGSGAVSSEFFTHLAAYEERSEVWAVVHAHPPKAVACTLAGIALTEPVLPELVAAFGGIPVAPYATPGTKAGAGAIRDLIQRCDALLLDRHGSITVGRDLVEAYLRLEKLEHACETILLARLFGELPRLDAAEVEKLYLLGSEYGASGKLFKS